ncbi:MAG TPA: hypothetical protein ENK75_05870 [Saprospiraceae bacterium]|nr:hypothetical protein [Saprospiraceae bacterium]
MKACKSNYDYEQLIENYIEYNLNYKKDDKIEEKYTSTAGQRLSFRGPILISYNTPIAKIISTNKGTYLLLSKNTYSVTTSKQMNILRYKWKRAYTIIETEITLNSIHFKEIVNELNQIISNYNEKCIRARNGHILQQRVQGAIKVIQSILPEVHHQTRKKIEKQLKEYPGIPDKLNKFTRPPLLSVLKNKGIL